MTVFKKFLDIAEKLPGHDFLHIPLQACTGYADQAITLTYKDALTKINELKKIYADGGYGHGQRIALIFDNRAEFFLHFQALNSLGISVVPVNSGFNREEMAYIVGHSDSSLLVTLPEYFEQAHEAINTLENKIPVIAADEMHSIPESPVSGSNTAPDENSEAAVLYTSGTTGAPKGCMLNNDYFISLGQWYADSPGYCELSFGEERMLTPLPVVHMNALCTMMAMIMSGGCIIQLDRFHASSWWECVRQSRATCLHYLGVIPAILLNQEEQDNDNIGDQIKFGFGAGVDPKHLQRFENRFGFKLVEGWAMTETGTHVCITTNEEPRHIGTRCVGKALNEIEYRLVDAEGNEVREGEPGELLIRAGGPNPKKGFFSGYYKNEAETEKVWEGGYFHTGDVLRVSEDGSFHFVDRRKNIIRRSGENIAAVEVENVMFQMQEVDNCAATPVYDEMRGEEVCAVIVLSKEIAPDETTAGKIFSFCMEKLVYYKTPGYFIFVPALPMTSSQKLQRGEIKKLAAAALEQGECIDLRERKRKRKK